MDEWMVYKHYILKHNTIVKKCPYELPSNQFFQHPNQYLKQSYNDYDVEPWSGDNYKPLRLYRNSWGIAKNHIMTEN